MIAASDKSAPFGTYALAPWRESLRRLADRVPGAKPGRIGVSVLRKASLLGNSKGLNGPFDVNVAEGVKARLFPASNRCEKRAFAGVQTWDARERAVLDDSVASHAENTPFVFLDVGANVGLYTLFVNASACRHQRSAHLIAIEPDPENRSRLTFNCTASHCKAVIEPIAVAGTNGQGILSSAAENRGEIMLLETGNGTAVPMETLASIIERHGLERVDAMKVDIEGQDFHALEAFFAQAPEKVWPNLVIAETNPPDGHRIADLMAGNGYFVRERTKLNAIFERAKGDAQG